MELHRQTVTITEVALTPAGLIPVATHNTELWWLLRDDGQPAFLAPFRICPCPRHTSPN